ncbi:MAG TPA: metal ABC transporter permease [Corynebacteriales bacterium]|nr:metal ABC transporter permease [Mycobacteriales bacterium]
MNALENFTRNFFDWNTTSKLLGYDFVQNALIAAALLGLISGLIGVFIVMRQMSFSVHGVSELALTGAAAALLLGLSVGAGAIIGSVIAALIFGLMGKDRSERDSTIGVLLSFGLGLAVLFLHLYPGRTGSQFSLLTGQIVSVSDSHLGTLIAVTVVVAVTLLAIGRPLLFSSVDGFVAEARGVPMRLINGIFAVLVGLVAAEGVQIVGALLVLNLLVTPAAAALQVTTHPRSAIVLSVVFAEISAVGGILLSLAPGVPMSVFVTFVSFAIYLVCRIIGTFRSPGKRPNSSRVSVPGAAAQTR